MRNLLCCCFQETEQEESTELRGENSDSNANLYPVHPPIPSMCGNLISWRDIVLGSENFPQTSFLGAGNFGDVYRCQLPNMRKLGAAKIQRVGNKESHLEFVAEVTALHAADNEYVIKLLAKCYEPQHRVILYEFMRESSLHSHLLEPTVRPGPSQNNLLDWETRMKVALGVAHGISYVHVALRMVHRDIKAENVLLDQNFKPKLSDFGLASNILLGDDGTEMESRINPIKKSSGWEAPETERNGLVSTKSDVYAFGVLLLRLFTGRKAYINTGRSGLRKLSDRFIIRTRGIRNYHAMILDQGLSNMYSRRGLEEIFAVAERCIRERTCK